MPLLPLHALPTRPATAIRSLAAQLAVRLAPYEAVVLIRERTAFPAALLNRLPNLKLISQTGKVSGHIDLAAATGAEQVQPSAIRRLAPPAPAADPLRDTKLDHSFKIAQVQVRVVREQLAAGEGMDREMVDRALETIDITASNARDMIKESRTGGAEGPVSGTVIG